MKNPFKDFEVCAISEAQMNETLANYKEAANGLDLSTFITPRQPLSMTEDGVAVIQVYGSLVPQAAPIHSLLGNTTYEQIHGEIDAALSAGAEHIVFDINSGGGSVLGLPELAQRIASLEIPTTAYSAGAMLSAAYYIGAAADDVYSSPSALVGSIGSIMTVVEMEEPTVHVFTSEGADLKGTFAGNLSESQAEFLQMQVDKAGEDFRMWVGERRYNVDPEVYRAGWYSGDDVLEMGLVDDQTPMLANLID